jgi:CRP-like cAMP-binding protein
MLGQFSDEDAEWLAPAGRRIDLDAGQVLIGRGKPIESLFIVLTGHLSVVTDADVEIARLGSGEIVGEMSLIDQRPPSATVKVLEPSSVLAIERRLLLEKIDTDTGFASRFYRALALFLSDRMRTTVGRFGYGKVAADEEEELPEAVLEGIHMAGARFESIMRRLMSPP